MAASKSAEGESRAAGPGPVDGPGVAGSRIAQFGQAALLFALLGASLAALAEGIFGAWTTVFLRDNTLDKWPRIRLQVSLLGGAGLSVLALSIAFPLLKRRRGTTTADLLRVAWLLAPFSLLCFLPVLLRRDVWRDAQLWLLATTALVAFMLEGSLLRAFKVVPDRVERAIDRIRQRAPGWLNLHAPTAIVGLGASGYALFMSYFTIRRHQSLLTANFDTSIQNQLLAAALEGDWLSSMVCTGKDGPSYLSNHAQLGGYVFLPIYALAPRAETLLVIESTLLGIGALALYWIGRVRLSRWTAALIALAYLAYHPMHGANFYEIQFLPIAAAFVLLTVWAADARKWVLFGIFYVLAITMREDISIGLAVVGLFFVLSGYRPRIGLVILITSAIYFVALRFYFMPAAGKWWFARMYKTLQSPGFGGFGAVIQTMMTNPVFVLKHMIVEKKIVLMLQLLTPLAFLPLRRRYLWLALVPGSIATLLTTDYGPTTELGFQYGMAWAPYLFLAVIVALAAIAKATSDGPERMRAALASMLLSTAVLSFVLGAFARPPDFKVGFGTYDFVWDAERAQRYKELRELAEKIPKRASVAAGDHVGPHVSSRTRLWELEKGIKDAEFVFMQKQDLEEASVKAELHQALISGTYGVLARSGELALLKKGHASTENPRLLSDWKL